MNIKSVTAKSLASILLVVMILTSFASPVSAATKSRTFKVRRSTDYSICGEALVSYNSNDPDKCIIEFLCDTSFYSEYFGRTITFDEGTQYKYTIKTMKDGKEISLKYVDGSGDYQTEDVMDLHGEGSVKNIRKITGKIHISGSDSFAHITKIDGFKKNSKKIGFYLRQD